MKILVIHPQFLEIERGENPMLGLYEE